MEMTKETETALKESIQHWQLLKTGEHTNAGHATCALCKLYHARYRTDNKHCCTGCPIKRHTKKRYCYGTPHDDFVCATDALLSEKQHIIQREINFLTSLLPEKSIKMKGISIKINTELHGKLCAAAKRNNRSLAQYLKILLANSLTP